MDKDMYEIEQYETEKAEKAPERHFMILISSIIILALVAIIFVIAKGLNQAEKDYDNIKQAHIVEQASKSITEGTIVDMRITDPETKAFGNYQPEQYVITIEGEYEMDGVKHKGTKDFTVSDSIYSQYSIGDYFDSKNV